MKIMKSIKTRFTIEIIVESASDGLTTADAETTTEKATPVREAATGRPPAPELKLNFNREAQPSPLPPAVAALAELYSDLPSLRELERRYLRHVLKATRGNATQAAKTLGIERRTLYRKALRLGVEIDEARSGR